LTLTSVSGGRRRPFWVGACGQYGASLPSNRRYRAPAR